MSLILVILAAICNAIMDVTQFHYHASIFSKEKFSRSWWDGSISWMNKYVNGDFTQGRTKVPVWFTDAFHFFKSSMIVNLVLAIVVYNPIVHPIIDFMAMGFAWNLFFRIFYKHILRL